MTVEERLDRIEKDLYGTQDDLPHDGTSECPTKRSAQEIGALRTLQRLRYEIQNQVYEAVKYRIESHLSREHRSIRQKALDRLDRISYAFTDRGFRLWFRRDKKRDRRPPDYPGFGSLR